MSRPNILDHRGNPLPRAVPTPPVRARYDAAQTDDHNKRHWAWADNYSARAANTPEVRRVIRSRARYEIANNSYAAGIVETLANDLIGSGPRLQLTGDDAAANREIEAAWCEWSLASGLAGKLRTMSRARDGDGEAFGLLTLNPAMPTPIKLDVRLYEAEQVATPFQVPLDVYAVDGLRFDQYGNVTEYHFLQDHPGDFLAFYGALKYDVIPPDRVLHWFRRDRPGQWRGISRLAPALPLFAELRRYSKAVRLAAEVAANFSAVLQSELPPDSEEDEINPFTSTEVEPGMMVTLPAGYTMGQFKSEQPTTTYAMFKAEILNEIARSLNVPYNVAAGNSSSYNYSSGRLDHQVYYRSLEVDRCDLERVVLDRVFAAWLQMMALRSGIVPPGFVADHRWLWPGMANIDPEKEANATATQLQTYMTTFSDECQRQGIDPEARAQQIARDVALFQGLGLPSPYQAKQPAAPAGTGSATDGQTSDQGSGGAAPATAYQALVHRNGHPRS